MKKFFTKEMGGNALITAGVLMITLIAYDRLVKPRLGGYTPPTKTPDAPAGE